MKLLSQMLISTAVFLIAVNFGWAELVLIGNASFKGKSVNKSDLKAIYQLSKKKIGDANIVFIDARISNRSELLNFLDESDKDLSNVWLKARLTGSSNPPKPLPEDEAIKTVISTPNAIAVVNKNKEIGNAVILMNIK